jgi:hypothetical protein
LDYYLDDVTAEYTWLSEGMTNIAMPINHTAPAVSGVIIRANDVQGAANIDSATLNWEWNNEDLPLICALFLQELGVQLPSPELYEGGTLAETKIEA